MLPGSENSADVIAAVEIALAKRGFLGGIVEILDAAQQEIEKRSPQCQACGKCCRFDEMDHRLFASTGELALLVGLPPKRQTKTLRCPWQSEHGCFAREQRPLGCRMFFCDEALAEDSFDIYEKFHARLIELHARYEVPYFYSEMTAAAWDICNSFV